MPNIVKQSSLDCILVSAVCTAYFLLSELSCHFSNEGSSWLSQLAVQGYSAAGPEGLFEEVVGSGLVSVRFGLCGLILWSLSWAETRFGRICSKMTVTSFIEFANTIGQKN